MPKCVSCQFEFALGLETCPQCGAEAGEAAKLASHALGFFNAQYYAEAAAIFERAHQASPEDAQIELAWAHALHHQGRRDRAGRIYHKLLESGMRLPELEFNLAQFDLAKGRLEEAREVFDRLSKARIEFAPQEFYLGAIYAGPAEFQSDCLYHLAIIHWNQGNSAFARLYFEKAIDISPGHAAACRYLGNLHFQGRDYARAVSYYRRFLELTLGSASTLDQQLDTHFRLASAMAELGKAEEAIEEFKRVLEQRPGHPGAIHQLSRLYAQKGIAGEEDLQKSLVIEASEGASTIFGLSTQPRTKSESQTGSTVPEHHPIVGKSLAMQRVLRSARLSAASESTVLIIGENGTGKELIAHAIHENSSRRSGPFITVSCAAVPENLLESELFGHERGSFTGATVRRIGRFEAAAGGTLFLDEVSALTPAMQVKLLRVLQERTFNRVGGDDVIRADIRLIAATNADLKAKIAREEFREDFYFRLSVLPIHVPPLRDRPEDIPLLAEYFIQKYKHQSGRRDYRLEADDLALLKAHTWPGNVRELENLIERGLVMGTQVGTILGTKPLTQAASAPSSGVGENAGDMIARLIAEGRIPERRRRAGGSGKPPASNWQPSTIGELEKAHILQTLRYTEGRRTQAARLLGINPATLWRKMKQYAIDESTEEGSAKDESAE